MNEFSFKYGLLCSIIILIWSLQIVSSYQVEIHRTNELSTTEYLKGIELNDTYKKSNHSHCPNDCSGNGQCVSGECKCYYFFSGDSCSVRWREDKAWFGFWTFYFLVVIFMHVGGLGWCVWNLYCMREKLEKLHWSKWPISAYIMMMFIFASFVRIFSYSVDPHNERQILGNIADSILFNVSIILWLSGGCLMFLYWIEIQRVSNIAGLNSVQKLRPILIGFVVVLVIVILPASICAYITDIADFILVYNIFLSLVFLGFIILLTWAGLKLINVLRDLTKFKSAHSAPVSERDGIFQVFLTKLSWLIMSLDAILVCLIVTLAVFEAIDARQHKWAYVITHFFLRLEEMAVVVCTNIFVMRKKPRGVDGTIVSQSVTMESYPIDANTRISLPRTPEERSMDFMP